MVCNFQLLNMDYRPFGQHFERDEAPSTKKLKAEAGVVKHLKNSAKDMAKVDKSPTKTVRPNNGNLSQRDTEAIERIFEGQILVYIHSIS